MFEYIGVVWCTSLCIVQLCFGSAVIEVRLVNYNSTGLLTSKLCCDTQTPGPCPQKQCDPIFFICLQDFSGSGCSLGNVTTGYIPNTDVIVFSDVIGNTRTPNPLVFNVDNYPGSVIAKVTVFDEDMLDGGQTNDKIDYLQYVYTFTPDNNGTTHNASTISLSGAVSTLDIEIRVHCDQNYYGNKCDVLCVPDTLYFCDENGKRLCRLGKICTSTSTDPTASRVTRPPSVSFVNTDSITTTSTPKPSSKSTSSSQTTSSEVSQSSTSTLATATSIHLSIPTGSVLQTLPTSTNAPFISTTTTEKPNNKHTTSTSRISTSTSRISTSTSRISITSSTSTDLPIVNVTHSGSCSYNASEIDSGNFSLYVMGYTNDLKSMIESHVINHVPKSNHDTMFTVHEQKYDGDTIYTINMNINDVGLTFNSSIIDEILEEFCVQVTARTDFQITKGDKSDSIKIIVPVVIIGLLVLLSIPMVYFICRRKCKNKQIGPDDTKDETKGREQRTLS